MTDVSPAPVAEPKPLVIDFVLDETGSMAKCHRQTVGGFNEFLNEQRSVPGLCQMSLTKFEGGNLKTPYSDLHIGMAPDMTMTTFIPGGMTNLYDAVLERIRIREAAMDSWSPTPNVLLVVMTDGDDNISKSNIGAVTNALQRVQAQGWTCVYLGADQDALSIGRSMGFRDGNIKSFSHAEMAKTMTELSNATTVYRTSAQTSDFFQG